MIVFHRASLALLVLVSLIPLFARGESPPIKRLGLTAVDGVLLRHGQPYRGIGGNYFDLFARVLRNPQDTSHRQGLARLARAGIPFVRFMACGFWPVDNDLYLKDKEAYFRRMNIVVRAAEEEDIGLIPSLFWNLATVSDIVGEPLDQLGNPRSRTIAVMRRYAREVVSRYKSSRAIWGWEVGNEYNLAADLPNAAAHRPPVWPALKTALRRSARDEAKFADLQVALRLSAETVRQLDPDRIIVSGNAVPRNCAYHNLHDHTWTEDTPEQFREILLRDNPSPIDTICVHVYPAADNRYAAGSRTLDELVGRIQEEARRARKPLFIGEFGVESRGNEAREEAIFKELLAAIEKHRVPLSAFWVYDYSGQDNQWNTTFDNGRSNLLRLVAQANLRIRRTMETGETRLSQRLNDTSAGPPALPQCPPAAALRSP